MKENGQPWTLLQRLDVALAGRAAKSALTGEDLNRWRAPWQSVEEADTALTAVNLLGLRGLVIHTEDATEILRGGTGRYEARHQEVQLIRGAARACALVRERCRDGRPPHGWLTVELFRTLTANVPRFRNNIIRRDQPWDAVLGVRYPRANTLPDHLDAFCPKQDYGIAGFSSLHPVRRATTMLWRFARLAPFPDFNLPLAVLVCQGYLESQGYPWIPPYASDRDFLSRSLSGARVRRFVQLESRLVRLAEQGALGSPQAT